jgi:hypothetical protein
MSLPNLGEDAFKRVDVMAESMQRREKRAELLPRACIEKSRKKKFGSKSFATGVPDVSRIVIIVSLSFVCVPDQEVETITFVREGKSPMLSLSSNASQTHVDTCEVHIAIDSDRFRAHE